MHILNSLFENEVYKNLLKERIIFLNGEIDDVLASEVVAKLLYLDSLSKDDITVYINSPGGEVSSGLMIYDTIKYLKSDVSTIGIGISASMASIILMSGTKGKRKILSHGRVMLHELSTKTSGKITDVIIAAKEASNVNNILLDIITKNSKFSLEEAKVKLSKDFYLSSSEALEFGIVDKIVV